MNDEETMKHAQRYLWLRDHADAVSWATTQLIGRQWVTVGHMRTSPEKMDADIDKARAEGEAPSWVNPKATPPPLLASVEQWVRNWLNLARENQ